MKRFSIGALGLVALPMLAACTETPTEGVATATVGSSEATPSAAANADPPSPEGLELAIDRASSSIGFTGAKVTATHDGSFEEFSGEISLDPSSVAASSVSVVIQMASLRIEPERLAAHLATPDFFDVARFPTATFQSTSVREGASAQIDGKPATHTVTGTLTLHGVSKEISFPAILTVEETGLSAKSEFVLNRRDFDIVYPGMPDDLIRDEVVIRFDVRAPLG
jgi:polyisoprenoid-binding protein YceI